MKSANTGDCRFYAALILNALGTDLGTLRDAQVQHLLLDVQ